MPLPACYPTLRCMLTIHPGAASNMKLWEAAYYMDMFRTDNSPGFRLSLNRTPSCTTVRPDVLSESLYLSCCLTGYLSTRLLNRVTGRY